MILNKNKLNDYKIPELKTAINPVKCDVALFPLFDDKKLVQEIKEIDRRLNGRISSAIKQKFIKGDLKSFKLLTIPGGKYFKAVLLAGAGKKEDFNTDVLYSIISNASRYIRDSDHTTFAVWPEHFSLNGIREEYAAYAIAKASILGLYTFNQKSNKEGIKEIKSILLITKNSSSAKNAVDKAKKICEATIYTRDLVNTCSRIVNPEFLVKEAKKLGGKNVKVEIISQEQLKKKGFNGILEVGGGSQYKPALIIMKYLPSGKPVAKPTVGLVGKGVTFDSGGLNLKPMGYIEDMRMDMGGAAVVLSLFKHIGIIKPKFAIMAAVPVCENMVSSRSYRPGDIIRIYNGKTVEVHNTDAEGRIIMADALSFISEQKPEVIIDIATLTGAMMVALGYSMAGLFSNCAKLAEQVKVAAVESHEKVWEMPLVQEHRESVEGTIGDLKNLGKDKAMAGASTAAAFLENFVNNISWVHLDIAGSVWRPETRDHTTQYATGFGTDLLLNFLAIYKPKGKK
ncbi:leucyl aminopeptidase [Candidatus Woesearchaeota archaeon]|nr:leucyl aminopeptidase [Candidatus Woesearchaeota archaeon]